MICASIDFKGEKPMLSPSRSKPSIQRHRSPHLGALAIVVTVLFCAGLFPVIVFGGLPHFPRPSDSPTTIAQFFQLRPRSVQLCAFLQFGAMIPLGIFAAAIVSRLRFLGVKAAGTYIALFGGFSAAMIGIVGGSILWTMAHPGIAQNGPLTAALYYFGDALGGPGYATTFGLLAAGISIPALFRRLMPRWIAILGLAVAVCGELAWLNMEFPKLLFFIPLTRFPGFVWMVAAGFALPSTVTRSLPGDAE
jgi:hypothetical protein